MLFDHVNLTIYQTSQVIGILMGKSFFLVIEFIKELKPLILMEVADGELMFGTELYMRKIF